MTASDIIQLAIAIPAGAGMLWAVAAGVIKLGMILKEVTPNDGGGSMKDRLMKLEVSQAAQTAALKRIEEFQLAKDQRLERIERKLDERPRLRS